MSNDTIEFMKIKDTHNVYYIRVERYEALCIKNRFVENMLDESSNARSLLIQHSEYVVSITDNILVKSRNRVDTGGRSLSDVVYGDFGGSLERFMDKYVFSL